MTADTAAPAKVGMISLGCAKNLVDAEIMLGSVLKSGLQITANADDADVLVVNTCAFIDSAKEESIEAILEAHQQRGLGKRAGQKLIVSGCMSQRFSRELREALPEVDAFVGLDQVSELGPIVERVLSAENDRGHSFVTERPTYIPNYDTPRFRLTPTHSAYLKIAEGCNHPCSFCVIPQMRGRHRSRPPASVLAETRALVAEQISASYVVVAAPERCGRGDLVHSLFRVPIADLEVKRGCKETTVSSDIPDHVICGVGLEAV